MTLSQIIYQKMLELAKLIHTALHSDSTWRVVLALAAVGAALFGAIGYLINTAYLSGLPHIETKMTTLNVATLDDSKSDCLIVIQATVSNTGSQSAVQDWNLFLDFPDGTSEMATPMPTDSQLALKGEGGSKVLRGEDALYKKTITPIVQGQIVPGFLAFVVKGKSKADLLQPGIHFRLVATDAFGKTHTSTKTREQFPNETHFPLIPVTTQAPQ